MGLFRLPYSFLYLLPLNPLRALCARACWIPTNALLPLWGE